ncbi:hypothetical protein [Botrimarina sp.]
MSDDLERELSALKSRVDKLESRYNSIATLAGVFAGLAAAYFALFASR